MPALPGARSRPTWMVLEALKKKEKKLKLTFG